MKGFLSTGHRVLPRDGRFHVFVDFQSGPQKQALVPDEEIAVRVEAEGPAALRGRGVAHGHRAERGGEDHARARPPRRAGEERTSTEVQGHRLALGRPDVAFKSYAVGLAAALVLGFWFVAWYGVLGAACGYFAANAIGSAYRYAVYAGEVRRVAR